MQLGGGEPRIHCMNGRASPRVLVVCVLLVCALSSGGKTLPLRPGAQPLYIEDSPITQELAARADDLLTQQRYTDAARTYQQIIDEHADKIIALDDTVYVGAARWVRMKLRADEHLLSLYRRTHEPTAQRLLARAVADDAPATVVRQIMSRFELCQAGLEAGLRLAAMLLTEGSPGEAAAVLDALANHPDLDRFHARYHYMHAAAALFAGRDDAYQAHRKRVEAAGQKAMSDELARYAQLRQIPAAGARRNQTTAELSMPQPMGKPLWTWLAAASSEGGSQQRAVAAGGDPFGGQLAIIQSAQGGVANALLPVAVDDMIYVNTYLAVTALDRNSGRVRWRHSPTAPEHQVTRRGRSQVYLAGPRQVCPAGPYLLTVVGLAPFSSGTGGEQTRLTCLNRTDGSTIWSVQAGELDQTLSGAFFVGTPQVSGDLAIVAVRRAKQRSIQDAFVVAVDPAGGQLAWKRHLVSAPMAPSLGGLTAAAAPTQWMVRNGRMYVTDVLGIAGCIEAADGSVIWINKRPWSPAEGQERPGTPADRRLRPATAVSMSRPILTPAGLIVPAGSSKASPVLLDAHSGRHLRRLTGPGFRGATQLLDYLGNVLTVGRKVRLVDGRTHKVLAEHDLPAMARTGPSGRALIVASRMLLPVRKSLIEFDLEKFEIVKHHPVEAGGHVLTLDGQVVVASPGRLDSYMNWSQAYARLTAQIAQSSDNPSPGLALANTALAAGKAEQVLEGVDAALAAMSVNTAGGQETMRKQVFAEILRLADPSQGTQIDLREELHERMAAATSGPADTVDYHLSIGRLHEERNRLDEAIEHYQLILLDPALARQLHHWGHGLRLAALETRLRQEALIEQRPKLYEPYDAAAADLLEQLTASQAGDAADYVSIAERYPLAKAAPQALLAAAEQFVQAGDSVAATAQLRKVLGMNPSLEVAGPAVSRLVELYLKRNQPDAARRQLLQFQRRHPDAQLLRNGQSITPTQWLGTLLDREGSIELTPRLALPLGSPTRLPGVFVAPPADGRSVDHGGAYLIRHDDRLSLHVPNAPQPKWTVLIGTGAIDLFELSAEQLLLYQKQTSQLLALDTATGKAIWPRVDVSKLLKRPPLQADGDNPLELLARADGPLVLVAGEELQIVRGRQLNEQQKRMRRMTVSFQKGTMHPLAAANHQMICVGEIGGGLAGIDRATGMQTWRIDCGANVTGLEMDEQLVLVGGLARKDRRKVTKLVGIEPATGRQRFEPKYFDDQFMWYALRDDGTFVVATAQQVASFDSMTGRLNWSLTIARGLNNGDAGTEGHMLGDRLLLASRQQVWRVFDLVSGKLIHQLGNPVIANRQNPFQIARGREHWHVLDARQAIALQMNGQFAWRDHIFGQPKLLLGQFVTPEHVFVLRQTAPAGPGRPGGGGGNGPYHYHLFALDRRGGQIVDEYDLGKFDSPINIARSGLVDGRLMLVAGEATWMIQSAAGQ